MTDVLEGRLVQRCAAVESAPLQHETILFNPQSNRFCILNRTSTFIWNQVCTPASAEQIAESLAASFAGVTPEVARTDVQKALSMLLELNVVETIVRE